MNERARLWVNDLWLALAFALLTNIGLFGYLFYLQGNCRVSIMEDFDKINIRMHRDQVRQIMAHGHFRCTGPGTEAICNFSDLWRDYFLYFDSNEVVKGKAVQPRRQFSTS